MNMKKFDMLANSSMPRRFLLAQDISEWKAYLEFVKGYFKNRAIAKPVVVEIGVMHNAQKPYYEELMDAEHIGVDINPNCVPDILGDSHKPQTMQELHRVLCGRKIDLLFIDGNHSYDNVKQDYDNYAPMTEHIVAFHDISASVNSDVRRFWQELSRANGYLAIAFNQYNTAVSVADNKFIDMGIGLIIKRGM